MRCTLTIKRTTSYNDPQRTGRLNLISLTLLLQVAESYVWWERRRGSLLRHRERDMMETKLVMPKDIVGAGASATVVKTQSLHTVQRPIMTRASGGGNGSWSTSPFWSTPNRRSLHTVRSWWLVLHLLADPAFCLDPHFRIPNHHFKLLILNYNIYKPPHLKPPPHSAIQTAFTTPTTITPPNNTSADQVTIFTNRFFLRSIFMSSAVVERNSMSAMQKRAWWPSKPWAGTMFRKARAREKERR